jgi:hypothetical protein
MDNFTKIAELFNLKQHLQNLQYCIKSSSLGNGRVSRVEGHRSRVIGRGSKVEGRKSRVKSRGSKVEIQESKMGNINFLLQVIHF